MDTKSQIRKMSKLQRTAAQHCLYSSITVLYWTLKILLEGESHAKCSCHHKTKNNKRLNLATSRLRL